MSYLGKRQEANQYATVEDFRNVFTEDLDGLYQLAYLVAGDHEKAEQAFVSGIEDSVNSNRVFKEWARSWAKRTVIQNAIRLVQPHPANSGVSEVRFVMADGKRPEPQHTDLELDTVLALEPFERFVFVMSVLERYSDKECALLLGCLALDVRQARANAIEKLANSVRTAAESMRDNDAVITVNRVIHSVDTSMLNTGVL
ncbi:MAG: hypothetical protein DMG97_07910 [Acidobacteria bacterium]|nr:MAG: hypothetical protein DMG97_07910 [Acidobacteriota bacterium]